MWPETKCPESLGGVEHPVTLFDIYFTKSEFKSFKLVYCLYLITVQGTSIVFIPTQMWPEISVSRVPGGIYLLCSIWNFTPV